MSKILEPIVGKRGPDMRWLKQPRTLSAKQRNQVVGSILRRNDRVTVRLRPRSELEQLVSPAVALIRARLERLQRDGKLVYEPEEHRHYDTWARRTYCDPENALVFEYPDDDDPDSPGVPLAVKARDAIVLLRSEPEGLGYLFEEVVEDGGEEEEAPKPKKSSRRKKASGKKKAKKADESADAPPLPGD